MINILIIPPINSDNIEFVCGLAKSIKEKFPQSCISTLVNVSTYDTYYQSGCVDGFIIEPNSILRKIFLFPVGQFDLALTMQNKIYWNLAFLRSGIKKKIFLTSNLDKQKDLILDKIIQILKSS